MNSRQISRNTRPDTSSASSHTPRHSDRSPDIVGTKRRNLLKLSLPPKPPIRPKLPATHARTVQNKPNSRNPRITTNVFLTKTYAIHVPRRACKNKANSEPIQTQIKPDSSHRDSSIQNRASSGETQSPRPSTPPNDDLKRSALTKHCLANEHDEMKSSFLLLALLLMLLCSPGIRAVQSPPWWRQTRAIYASFDLSGAGGPLMKFPSDDINKKLRTLGNLPILLEEARKLGCSCLYLVSYWHPDYAGNKGDYQIRTDLGGPQAFKEGVEKLHAAGGRIILYLEPFIITRTSKVGREHGLDWCMKDPKGNPQTYYGNAKYYLMWPAQGSGWTDYIIQVAERLVRDFKVDGFHLDSYGCQWDLKDSDPKHKGSFNAGAINLVRTMRQRIKRINPDAIIILECCERTELLDLCDGGQIESGAWLYSPVKVLNEKPWVVDRKYKAFTSHYSMTEMDKILDMGYNFSLCPWWFENNTTEKDFERMRRRITRPDDWIKRVRILWNWDNLLYINNIPRPANIDLFERRRQLEMRRYAKPRPQYYETDEYWTALNAYEPLIRSLLKSKRTIVTPDKYLRNKLTTTHRTSLRTSPNNPKSPSFKTQHRHLFNSPAKLQKGRAAPINHTGRQFALEFPTPQPLHYRFVKPHPVCEEASESSINIYGREKR